MSSKKQPNTRQAAAAAAAGEKSADVDKQQSPISTRRHLYTEKSRVSMSAALAADLPSGSIDTSLAELDARSKDPGRSTNGDIVVGPFSVLNMTPVSCSEAPPKTADVVEEVGEQGHVQPATPPVNDMPPLALSPSSMMIGSLAQMDDFLHWSDLFDLGPDPLHLTPHPFLESVNGFDFAMASTFAQTDTLEHNNSGRVITPQQSPLDTGSLSMHVMPDAPFLLKHFQDNVIAQMMAMPLGEKSPWKILNVPAAVLAYSDLTFLGAQNISHARLANLYSLLACSAYHLASNPDVITTNSVEHWKMVTEQAHRQAKDHIQMSLKHETHQPKKAKYKDQLMAICGMTGFAV
jgi:arginine metabolism regulation protein II